MGHAWLAGQEEEEETSRPDALSPVKNIKRFAAPVPSACHINGGGPGGWGGGRAAAHAGKGAGHVVSGGGTAAAHVSARSTRALNMSETETRSEVTEGTSSFGGGPHLKLKLDILVPEVRYFSTSSNLTEGVGGSREAHEARGGGEEGGNEKRRHAGD